MSRRLCNQVLAGSAVASLVLTILLVLVVQRVTGFDAILQIIGKWLLLWTATAVVVGIATEAGLAIVGRVGGVRLGASNAASEPSDSRVPQV